ncbi:hypothetical protein [Microbacterium sp. KNMS]
MIIMLLIIIGLIVLVALGQALTTNSGTWIDLLRWSLIISAALIIAALAAEAVSS